MFKERCIIVLNGLHLWHEGYPLLTDLTLFKIAIWWKPLFPETHLPHELLLRTRLEFKMWSTLTEITKSIQAAGMRKSIERAWANRPVLLWSLLSPQHRVDFVAALFMALTPSGALVLPLYSLASSNTTQSQVHLAVGTKVCQIQELPLQTQ